MNEEIFEYIVHPTDEGKRLDVFANDCYPRLSRNQIQKLIQKGRILVDGQIRKAHAHVRSHEVVKITLEPIKKIEITPQKMDLDILFEDEDILVINKPPNLVVHPAPGHADQTLVNALLAYGIQLPLSDDVLRPGIVHRLDKDTSGCLIVAKNIEAMNSLSKQFESREVGKLYVALVAGKMETEQGVIDLGISRHPIDRKKMSVNVYGRSAYTSYNVIETFHEATFVKILLKTGRTHQIRVHMTHLGHPVLGDLDYGRRHKSLSNRLGVLRQLLHAHILEITHPKHQKRVKFEAPIPEDFNQVLLKLRSDSY